MVSECEPGVARIIDANANRAREGLRVTEEITRLILNDAALTERLKEKRHAISNVADQLRLSHHTLISARDSEHDVGMDQVFDASTRTDCGEILRANLRRSQESCRVLEEFSKLCDPDIAASFKKIRFDLYTLEKEIAAELRGSGDEKRL